MSENLEDFKQEILDRKEELKLEYGETDLDEIRINELLRDEFTEEDYEDALIELGISDEDLGIDDDGDDKDSNSDWFGNDENKNKDKLLQILLNPEIHIFQTEKRLRGYELVDKKYVQKRKFLVPEEEIQFIIQILETLYLPQNLASKLNEKIIHFEDSMNRQLHSLRVTLEDYPDEIVSAKEMRMVIDMMLNEVLVISNAIRSGRLGDLTRDMVINSYNEKSNDGKPDGDDLKKRIKNL